MPRQVYFESDGVGDWYDCVAVTNPGESPLTAPDKWRRIEIPQCLEGAIVDLAIAYVNRGEGQADKSLAERRYAAADMDALICRHADLGDLTQMTVFTR